MQITPELLAPAGTYRSMRYAFAYGADAVYAGQPRYSLRVRNNDFTLESLATGIDEAHQQGRTFYVACNIAPHNAKVRRFIDDMVPVIEAGPDALIMSDPGLIMLVRDRWPDMPVHLSVQSNVVNHAAVEFWRRQGVSRIILSRELSLEEIEEIQLASPQMELEVFVHGALCIAYSGRCLLSGYMNHRDPNQGACTNACRWEYDLLPAQQSSTGEVVSTCTPPAKVEPPPPADEEDGLFLLRERSRPDEVMPIFEDEHGTYILNSRDLRAVQHVERLGRIGIRSLKIEGRTKSHFYAARTTQVYRRAIDDAAAGRPFDLNLMDVLEGLANRGYTEGFYRRHPPGVYQNYEQGQSRSDRQQFVGEVVDSNDNWLTIEVKNQFAVGDALELMTPQGNHRFQLDHLEGRDGKAALIAPGSGHRVKIPRPPQCDAGEYALLIRNLVCMINAFELERGRLRQVQVESIDELRHCQPVWIDFVDASDQERDWASTLYGIDLPEAHEIGDIEARARFFEEKTDNGDELHIRSDFFHEDDDGSQSIRVAFVLKNSMLFSVHPEDLPQFRLVRMRARSQPGYVEDLQDVLLELYAADVEYSADVLEGIYERLDGLSEQVLGHQIDDETAATVLSSIAKEENLNGHIRRNLMDTRRAISFLMRHRSLLSSEQHNEARQILRDMDSIEGHTGFLFDKLTFLMDATIGFININQNKVVKIFSVASVCLLPPTLIASIYGMNFELMPELKWSLGYPFSLLLMGISVVLPFWYFQRKGWLK